MQPLRPLVLWLAAAIAMIAVGVLPSAASAHDGHHGGRPHVASAVATPMQAVEAQDAVSPRQADASRIEARLICTGPCCLPAGHACSSCCASGLMPAADLAWEAPAPGGAHRARDLPRPAGIVPEALPEPPRPVA